MSLVARVIRQFHEGREAISLEPLAHATLAREGGWRDTPKGAVD